MDEAERQEMIREALLSTPRSRESAQAVVEEMLQAVAYQEPEEVAPAWAENALEAKYPGEYEPGSLTVGELRDRLRATLAEIAARDTQEWLGLPDG